MKYIHNFDILPPAFRRHLFGTVQQMFPDNGERSSSGRLRRLMGVIAAAEDDQYFQLMNRTNEHLRKRLFGEMMTVRGDDGRSYIADLFRECTTPDQAEKALEENGGVIRKALAETPGPAVKREEADRKTSCYAACPTAKR